MPPGRKSLSSSAVFLMSLILSISAIGTTAHGALADTWSPTGSLTTGRAARTATLLSDGRVLAAGGYNNGHLASAEIYDPATGTWSPTLDLTARAVKAFTTSHRTEEGLCPYSR